jgi:hypothetical protein
MTNFDVYMNRCEAAVDSLVKGKRIHVYVAVLDELGVDVRQWMIDLKNAISVEFYDPSDCMEDSYSDEYKVSVKVSNGIATASAKAIYKV